MTGEGGNTYEVLNSYRVFYFRVHPCTPWFTIQSIHPVTEVVKKCEYIFVLFVASLSPRLEWLAR